MYVFVFLENQHESAAKEVNKAARKLHAAFREIQRKNKQKLGLPPDSGTFVNLDDYDAADFDNSVKNAYWLEDLLLMRSDRSILESNSAWLNASIIDASQRVLAQQFKKGGLQEVGNGLTMSFQIEPGEFIQVLHDPNGHWVCVSNIGAAQNEVFVYDSLFSACSSEVVQAIMCILQPTVSTIRLSFVEVHKQSGGADCGVFAIANATILCMGLQPGKYVLDQQRIRKHLIDCLNSRKFSMFPIRRERRNGHKILNCMYTVYVECQMSLELRCYGVTIVRNGIMVKCASITFQIKHGRKKPLGDVLLVNNPPLSSCFSVILQGAISL